MNEQVLDIKDFLERVQDDKPLLIELLDIYVDDFKMKRSVLEAAIKNNNCEDVRNIAHSLKGSSGNISAKLLRETFLKLEEMGKMKELLPATDLLSVMDKQFVDLIACVEELKKEFGG